MLQNFIGYFLLINMKLNLETPSDKETSPVYYLVKL